MGKVISIFIVFFIFSQTVANSQEKFSNSIFTGKLPAKKIIQLGWEQPSPQILKQNYKMMEATSAFDGVAIGLRDTVNGFAITDGTVFTPVEIKKEWLKNSIADLKSCNFTKFKHNFLRINTVPGTLKWNDDHAWAVVAKNMGVMAWFAKQSGLEGFMYDPESYVAPQFGWKPSTGLTFNEAQQLARKRGGQIMSSIAQEYPDITVFGLFMFSLGRHALQSPDMEEVIKTDHYALYPAFLNGMLDKLPPKARMVEGNEEAYYPASDLDLHLLYNDARMKTLAFIAPENMTKFKTQYSVGFGLYVDMYTDDLGVKYYLGPEANRTRTERFRDRLTTALDITDEYVWVYNEVYKWWDIPYCEKQYHNSQKDFTLCEQKLPGVTAYMEYAKDPAGYVKKLLNNTTDFKNIAVNPGFEEQVEKVKEILDWKNSDCPSGYLLYKDEKLDVSVVVERGSGINNSNAAVTKGFGGVTFIQGIPVVSGETYAVSVEGKKTGGSFSLQISWLDDYNNLVDWYVSKDVAFMPIQDNVWGNATIVIKVPQGRTKMQVFMNTFPVKETDRFYFDNLKVVKVNDLLKIK